MLHVYMYVQHVDGDNANPHPTQIVVTAGGGEGLRMRFSDGCPHALAVECLGRFLDTTRSLPLFLQGLWVTEGVMHILDEFAECVPGTSVSMCMCVAVSTSHPVPCCCVPRLQLAAQPRSSFGTTTSVYA